LPEQEPRFIIIGAGAVGVTFAAELRHADHDVALVARGAQLEAARHEGITYVRPDRTQKLEVPVHGEPGELRLTERDVLVLATKSQDAAAALEAWARQPVDLAGGGTASAGRLLPLLTTQNGLEAERVALRHFRRVIGSVLVVAAEYVEPGVVVTRSTPSAGLLWIGAYPDREAPELEPLAAHLRRASFDCEVVGSLSAWKNGKLITAVRFALDALYAPTPLRDRAAALLEGEAMEIFAAAGAEVADLHAAFAALRHRFEVVAVPGHEQGGFSTWQSLRRGSSLETPYLNGEVVLQARLLGGAAPANRAILERVLAVARDGAPARGLGDKDLLVTLPELAEAAAAPDDVLIDPVALREQLRGEDPPAVLDVRWKLGHSDGRIHYAEGHVPTAVYVDLDTELASRPSPWGGRHPLPTIGDLENAARRWGVNQDQPVVVYDDSSGLAAARAWWLLKWAGVGNVRILDGALGGWIRAGMELESGEPDIMSGDVRLSEGRLSVIDADDAQRVAADGLLLDARASERYRGEHEPVDRRAGHIPGALSAPAQANLDDSGRFLPADVLRRRFEELGVTNEATAGVYCGSGVTAAHLLAALRIAGFDATLFPGSWSAWSSDPERPVAVGAQAR
jgi:thiosulfate/3-mercaptopyruvate sulfurtransferase